MRLYPPIWMLIRVADSRTSSTQEIRVGDKVALFAYGAHHNPKYWEEPETFMPERWLGDAAKKRKPYTYLPFGGGKRSCIGGAMSQVENTLALSILLRRFRPEYVGVEPPGINATVPLTPQGRPALQDPRAELGRAIPALGARYAPAFARPQHDGLRQKTLG